MKLFTGEGAGGQEFETGGGKLAGLGERAWLGPSPVCDPVGLGCHPRIWLVWLKGGGLVW